MNNKMPTKEVIALKQTNVIQSINKMKAQIAAALPKHITPDRMARIAMTAIRGNYKLALCNEASLLASVLQASQLGLEPNTPLGECYLIPYGDECTFQLGYKGLLNIAHRSGQYKKIDADQVYKDDIFKYTKGLNAILQHEEIHPQLGDPIFYYAFYQTVNDGEKFVVWTRQKVIDHAKKYSQSYNSSSSPWKKNFDAMAKKTVIIDVLKYGPKSIELHQAMSVDNAQLKIDTEATLDSNEIVLLPPEWKDVEAETEQKRLDDILPKKEES